MNLYYNSESENWSWNDNCLKNYLDFYIGIEFKKFIFSWHLTNILYEDYLINKGKGIKDFRMQHWTVKWKFDN